MSYVGFGSTRTNGREQSEQMEIDSLRAKKGTYNPRGEVLFLCRHTRDACSEGAFPWVFLFV